jgi:hypothetical protein
VDNYRGPAGRGRFGPDSHGRASRERDRRAVFELDASRSNGAHSEDECGGEELHKEKVIEEILDKTRFCKEILLPSNQD